MLPKIFRGTLLALTTVVCASFPPTYAPLTEQKVTTSNSTVNPDNDVNKSFINWQPCVQPSFANWFPSYAEVDTLQCATIEVPLINAGTPTVIKLAISRLPASGSEQQKLGTLISISGGPGQSGLDVSPINSAAYQKLSRHFDIIGYAPRGVHPSTPTVKCSTVDRVLTPEDAESFAQGCWEHTPHDLLTQLGADYAVNDIEAIRQALGVPKVSLIGYSYGTKIAALYAEKFPQYLRAGVLDGVVNLNETELQMAVNQSVAVQKTFERFLTACRQKSDCYFADTDTVAAAEAKLAKLYYYIESHQLYDLDGQRILPVSLSGIIYDSLMWPEQWPMLDSLFHQLENEDFELYKQLIADQKDNTDFATFAAILCADGAPTSTKKAAYIDDIKRVDALLTWDDFRKFTDKEIVDTCYYWPIAGSDIPHVPKLSPSAPPLLLIAQTDDPATPYINALAMQKYLNSVLLTRNSDGHTLALSDLSSCVDNQVVDYLIDPNSLANGNNNSRQGNIYCAK